MKKKLKIIKRLEPINFYSKIALFTAIFLFIVIQVVRCTNNN